jgi:hypothetical protein
MDTNQDKIDPPEPPDCENDDGIEEAIQQMAVLYKSRCIQAPLGTNIIIREIDKEE